MTTRIGVVGLGTMGGRIAGRLLTAGFEVHGTNRSHDRALGLLEQGLRWHDTAAEVARTTDVVISMVTDDVALDAVTSGPDGIIAGLRPGMVYVDMSSVSPGASRRVAGRAREAGADMLDAPVSGSVPQVEAGTLTIMVGGPDEAFRAVEQVLRTLGDPVVHVGGNGAGVLMKLSINISLAVQTLAFSEGLLLAERGGIDPALAAEVMSASPIGSPMLKARVPMLLDLPEQAWFTIQLLRKDIELARAEGALLSVALPSTGAAAETLATAVEDGYGASDIAGLYEVLGKISANRP